MRLITGAQTCRVALGALGMGLAALTAPIAVADPAVPAEPIVPASATAPADPAPAVTAPDAAVAAAPGAPSPASTPASITPPDGVSHLPSPDSLPPGTTSVAQTAQDHPTLGYLKDVWNAVRGKQVSPSDALILLAQRPVDNSKLATSVPQQQPVPGAAPADPAAPAAPAPAPAAPAPVPPAVSAEVPPAG